jgi:tetratricopeptide (TPR) repeat protein
MKHLLFLVGLIFLSLSGYAQGEQHYEDANTLYDQEKYKEALPEINEAVKAEPYNVDYLNKKGLILSKLRRHNEALIAFTRAIDNDPTYFGTYLNRSVTYQDLRDMDKSLADLDKAYKYAKTDSDRIAALVNRAAAHSKERSFQLAYNDLMRIYLIDSNNVGMLTNLAAICDEIGKGNETLKYLFRVIKIDPTFFQAYGNIGFKYQEMGDHKKAIEYYNKVLELKPDEPLGYSNRAFNKLKLGDLKGAYADIDKSLSIFPDNSYAYRIRGLIYVQDHKAEQACKDFDTALGLDFTKMYGDEVLDLKKKYCQR